MSKNKTQRIRELGFAFAYNMYLKSAVNKVFRRYVYPNVGGDFSSFTLEQDVNILLENLIGKQAHPNVENEFKSLNEMISERYKNTALTYPDWRIGRKTSFLIYSIVRLLKPNKVVETGVANGHSTFFILNALKRNETGSLYSIDVSNDVGSLISEDLKPYWNLYVLPKKNKKTLNQYLNKIKPIDIFIHDSNHMYYWQMIEYESFLKNISSNGFILSDDVDSSYAFIDFCNKNKLEAVFLNDNKKVFGATKIQIK